MMNRQTVMHKTTKLTVFETYLARAGVECVLQNANKQQ